MEEKYEEWEEKVLKPFLAKSRERKEWFLSEEGLEIKRLYTPLDLKGWNYLEKDGFPGSYPFTRRIYPTMYRGRIWTIRQYSEFGSAEDTNRRYKYLLQTGQTGLSLASTQITKWPIMRWVRSEYPCHIGRRWT